MSGGNEDPTSVAVALRVRPLVQSEVDRGCLIAVERTSPGAPQVIVNRSEMFTFNHVFDVDATQREIYESCVLAKQRKLLQGYNVTILAYGQTGSGKTFTMGTSYNGVMDESAGVIPRAVDDIFREIGERQEEYSFSVTCSFVELYQEQFFDLFSPGKITVDIKEVNKRVVMPGLTELAVKSAQEVTDYLMRGSSGRAVAATAMNETSSRSHAIFTLTLVATKKDSKAVTTSRFNLVDLAGSERCSKTLASGDRFKEGVNINKGLLALGNVINALGATNAPGYIPYRQSKLTRLLQDSLGGNSITLMIACVSPADYNVAETVSTLRYADRALQIKNKPVVNQDPHAAEVNMLKDIIQKLRVQLLGGGKMSSSITSAVGAAGLEPIPPSEPLDRSENQRLQEQVRSLQERNRKLQQELHQSLVDLTEKEMRAHIAEQAHDALRAHVLQLKEKLEQQQQEQQARSGNGGDGDERLREISQLVEMVDDQLQRTQEELESHDQETRHQLSNGHDHSYEAHEMLHLQSEEYTDKQLNLASELRNINRQLDLKQELHVRIMRNFSKLEATDEDLKLRQCNQKIEDLEEERRSLLDQLRNIKTKDSSAKIAEERRKRLQTLEQEIADLRRKVISQANMLKMREKEREKIKNLSDEIKIMKESKVKLIRTMRGESEKFRQLRMVHQKEVTQLKSKDRKMQSEMVRQQTLHAKQRQVLKRKCEEAMAANKRLKDALDRQASAQAQRQKSAKNHGTAAGGASSAKADSWVERELEIILSLVDAEHSLEQLMEDRAEVNRHYHQMEQQTSTNPADAKEQARLLASLEEELEMRNAQISDLQQKVCQSDLDSRIRALSEGVQSIAESRSVSKQLVKTLVQQRRQQALSSNEQRTALDDVRAQLLEAQQMHESLSNRLKLAEAKHEEQMLSQQRSYEEKVALLLRAPKDEEVVVVEEESRPAKSQAAKSKATLKTEDLYHDYMSDLNDSQEVITIESDDPDWVPSKRKKNKSLRSQSNSITESAGGGGQEAAAQLNGTEVSNASSLNFTAAQEDGTATTRCKCRTKCNGQRCACFLGHTVCSEKCYCKGHCMNPLNVHQKPPDTDGEQTQNENCDTFISPDQQLAKVVASPKRPHDQKDTSTPLSDVNNAEKEGLSGPKLVRMSELPFDTPKRKFF
ncbi:chromosome-associated kinesin KIF4 [Drosophila kikkawai]|uniref:Chromosome-associated kinesin KIF4 n=1 Tax=Drosophila kikkawai TaxID=30033 RepID=A0A6P4IJJ2_DROKI|nr:chromosome-associated kinesin KIF4 [Drosophila kikkawai]